MHRIIQSDSRLAFRIDWFACGHFLRTDYGIAHVTVINPGRGEPRRDMTIVVHEDAIVAVLPSKQFRPTSSVKVIEKGESSSSPYIGGPYLDRSGEKSDPDFPNTLL